MLIAIVAIGFALVVFVLIDTAQSLRQLHRALTVQAYVSARRQSAILMAAVDGLEAILDTIDAPRCRAVGDCPNLARYRVIELDPPGPDHYAYTCADHDRWEKGDSIHVVRTEISEPLSRRRFYSSLESIRTQSDADLAQS